jgi:hypothetical protein
MDRLKSLLAKLNKDGIPAPLVRCPDKGRGSVSLTLVFLSSLYVQIALLNSFAQLFKGVDVINALYWHGMCLSLYFGRSFASKNFEVKGNDEQSR